MCEFENSVILVGGCIHDTAMHVKQFKYTNILLTLLLSNILENFILVNGCAPGTIMHENQCLKIHANGSI